MTWTQLFRSASVQEIYWKGSPRLFSDCSITICFILPYGHVRIPGTWQKETFHFQFNCRPFLSICWYLNTVLQPPYFFLHGTCHKIGFPCSKHSRRLFSPILWWIYHSWIGLIKNDQPMMVLILNCPYRKYSTWYIVWSQYDIIWFQYWYPTAIPEINSNILVFSSFFCYLLFWSPSILKQTAWFHLKSILHQNTKLSQGSLSM